MRKPGRFEKRLVFWASVLAIGVLPTHCATTLEDAVMAGVARVVTDATAQVLSSFLPFSLDGSGTDGGSSGGGGDPFSNPPLQS